MWFFFPLNYTRVVFIHFKEKKVLNHPYFFGFSFVIYIARRTQHGPLVIEQLLGVGEKVDSEMDCLGELPPLIQLINDATLHWRLTWDYTHTGSRIHRGTHVVRCDEATAAD